MLKVTFTIDERLEAKVRATARILNVSIKELIDNCWYGASVVRQVCENPERDVYLFTDTYTYPSLQAAQKAGKRICQDTKTAEVTLHYKHDGAEWTGEFTLNGLKPEEAAHV